MGFFADDNDSVEPIILNDEILDNGLRYVRAVPQGGVCSQMIEVAVKDGVIDGVRYTGGCNGNTKGIAALVQGMTLSDAAQRMEGIACGMNTTSCPDQLSRVLKYILNKK